MILLLVYFLCFRVNIVHTEDKRLLLNDPDVLVNRLNRVESVLAVLNSTVVQLKTENQQQALTIQQQERTIQQLQSSLNSVQNSGATYIIWGRKQCPNNNTELVYSGYAGGGHYTEKGAAVEYVCLPPDPNYVKTSGQDKGRMYGAEFYNTFFASDGPGEDVPCALCRTNHANTAIMIPGENTCYSGWKVEYHGYLSSGYYGNDAATTYVCVDIKPEYIIGGVNQNLGLGITYIRWGRKQCPNSSTELVYSGFAGGGHYGDTGSAAEYVCLPPDPNYLKTSGGDNGRMLGAEFTSNFFASNSYAEDVPCALCRIDRATSLIMIPGKNTCNNGWKEEYHGYLASGLHSHNVASAYICVDIHPEYIMGGVGQHYGKLFYEVITKCGSLKCPPYINNYPLTCVVCSK
ncbi:unnamed protein product [Mytilus coruscus]|uniref:Short-chain collagen C4-like n=1 Tax=Mytilus coruscus TaxID=42192 RepID=A0A6J8DHI9_MYTCO|nr:unnamed protein product [Mytilus coruscus]